MKIPPLGTIVRDSGIAVAVAELPADRREEWDERAAILEYDAGHERAEAERQALAMVRVRVHY